MLASFLLQLERRWENKETLLKFNDRGQLGHLQSKLHVFIDTSASSLLGSISGAPSGPAFLPGKRRLPEQSVDHVFDVNSKFNLCGATGHQK